MIDRIFVHMESKGMYKVVEVSEDPYTGKQTVKYERLGDGYSAQLPMSSFHQKLRPAEQDELEALNAVLPRLQAMGKGAFVDKVMQISTNPEQMEEQQGQSQVGILVTPTEEHDFSRIIVHDDVKKSIEMGLTKITKGELLTNLFGMKSNQGRCIMNFYGAPGHR